MVDFKKLNESLKHDKRKRLHPRMLGDERILAAFDCETTGGELFHGDLPFMVCMTFENKEQLTFEWAVNPNTRTPLIEIDDLVYIVQLLTDPQYCWIGHNIKFDARCIEKAIAHILGNYNPFPDDEVTSIPSDHYEALLQNDPAFKTLLSFDPLVFLADSHDTHTLSHAPDNRGSHGLKDLCVRYLDIGEDDVQALQVQVEEARKFGKQHGWRIASPSTRPLDSQQEESNKWWKIDMWVPHAYFRFCEETVGESKEDVGYFNNMCQTYCLRDTERTLLLFVLLRDLVIKEDLWDQYLMNQRLLSVSYDQERYGASIHMDRLLSEQKRFNNLAVKFNARAMELVNSKYVNLNSTEQVALCLKTHFGIPLERTTKFGKDTINKDELEMIHSKYSEALHSSKGDKVFILTQTEDGKKPVLIPRKKVEDLLEFIMCCMARKKCIKAANQDLAGYKKRALGYLDEQGNTEWYLHSGVNLVGTDTTRISAHDPNLTNISKGKNAFNEDVKELDLSLRKIFGPSKGRKWVSFDYAQLQLVIAATISGEQEVIETIQAGGDLHLFMHKVLAEKLHWTFDEHDDGQRTIAKNTNFGFWFGAGPSKIDKTTHTTGIHPILCERFPNAQKQIRKDIREAERIGFVSASGYRLYPPPDKPYAATVYKVQGWEGKIAKRAACMCHKAIQDAGRDDDVKLVLFIHDELVFDMPDDEPIDTIQLIKSLMIEAGSIEGITVNVGVKEIRTNYQEGKSLSC